MKTRASRLILISFILTSFSVNCQNTNNMINNETVKKLDIEKYLGTWYEIARFPHSFEKDLVGVTATYSFRKDGKIKVVNKGYKYTLNGKEKIATGKAKIPNINDPGKLKVSFFWFFYGDYFVMELDKEYQWAVIGSSSDKYLWILSRSPQLDNNTYDSLIKKIRKRGYNLNKLIKVDQFKNK